MDCEQARERIHGQLDGDPPSVELAGHLRGCPDCAEYSTRLQGVHEMLADEAEVEWRPELTAGVMRRIRTERSGSRWRFVAAAAMVLCCGWLGTVMLSEIPAFAEADRIMSEKVELPDSPNAALSSLGGSFDALLKGTGDLLAATPEISGVPLAILGLLLVLALDGLLFGRSVLTRGRKS